MAVETDIYVFGAWDDDPAHLHVFVFDLGTPPPPSLTDLPRWWRKKCGDRRRCGPGCCVCVRAERLHWTRLPVKQTMPSARGWHSCCCSDAMNVLLFGGYSGGVVGDLWNFNLGTQRPGSPARGWRGVSCSGVLVCVRVCMGVVCNHREEAVDQAWVAGRTLCTLATRVARHGGRTIDVYGVILGRIDKTLTDVVYGFTLGDAVGRFCVSVRRLQRRKAFR